MKTKRILSALLALVMIFALYSCSKAKAETVELTASITAKSVEGKAVDDTFRSAHANFAARLFKESFKGENTLISPLSVMVALGMLGNGLEGASAEQLATLFGGIEAEELSKYLYTYVSSLPSGEKHSLDFANSVWMTDKEGYDVKEAFLQALCDYYSAEAYKTDLISSGAVDAVNDWISEKTDGMIDKMLDYIDKDACMLLINTLLFEAEWAETYEKHQVKDGAFTTETGEKKTVSMMYSDESVYLENENATGVVKPYAGKKYAFAALLPKEGVSLEALVDSLDGNSLAELFASRTSCTVFTAIPEFELDYGIMLNDALKSMGLSDPFDCVNSADFAGIYADAADHQFHISRVLHKTRIEMSPIGTKAGAATVIELTDKAEDIIEGETKKVYLDRPFVYMIVDTETDLPIFIGAVTDIGE